VLCQPCACRPCAQDTARFCVDTLCEPELVAFLNSHFVCWGGDVRSSDAFRASRAPACGRPAPRFREDTVRGPAAFGIEGTLWPQLLDCSVCMPQVGTVEEASLRVPLHPTACNVSVRRAVCTGGCPGGCATRRARASAQLAGSLRATGYPFVALLAFSGARTRLVASSQGAAAPGPLAAALKRAADEHGASLVAEQAEHRERACPDPG